MLELPGKLGADLARWFLGAAQFKVTRYHYAQGRFQLQSQLYFLGSWRDVDMGFAPEVGADALYLRDIEVLSRTTLTGAFASSFVLPVILDEILRRLARTGIRGLQLVNDDLELRYQDLLQSVLEQAS